LVALSVALVAAFALGGTALAVSKSAEKIIKKKDKRDRIVHALSYNDHARYVVAGNDDDEYGDDGESWYERAHSYYMRGRFDKAGRAYDNAAKFGTTVPRRTTTRAVRGRSPSSRTRPSNRCRLPLTRVSKTSTCMPRMRI